MGHWARTRQEAAKFVVDVEEVSRIVDYLQILAARLADERNLAETDADRPARGALLVRAEQAPAAAGSPREDAEDSPAPTGNGFRDCTEFLRTTLRISRAEAKRRLSLADVVLPRISPTGTPVPAGLGTLGAAVTSGRVSGRAATVVAQALQRVNSFATKQQFESMEHHLTRQAMEADEDILRVLARRWEGVLDQDGQEPTDKVLRARQGVFLRGRRHGLHVLEIGATDEQFELLATVMNSTSNPRCAARTDGAVPDRDAGAADTSGNSEAPGSFSSPESPDTPDSPRTVGAGGMNALAAARGAEDRTVAFADPPAPTRAQTLLDGLVAACRIALSTAALPAAGGHRPQVMVTIDHKDLVGATQRAGYAVFSGQMSAGSIRKLACDADIIPLVLGSSGQVLDVGRAQRFFPPHLRRALVARDKGCAFPDCSIPASWCEAHHLKPWSRGGVTSIDNGVLLCSRHHHVIHQGAWTVQSRDGVPWFTAPRALGPPGSARRNRYWQAGRIVDETLIEEVFRSSPDAFDAPDVPDALDPSAHDADVLDHSTG